MDIANLVNRNGVYYVRKRVPEDLIDKLGKKEIQKSLRTKDQKIALKLFPDALSEIEAEFDRCRDEKTPSSNTEPSQFIFATEVKRIYSDKFKAVQTAELNMRQRVFKFLQTEQKQSVLWGFHPRPKPMYEPYLDVVVSEGDINKIAGFLKEVRNEHRIAELKERFTIGDVEDLKAEALEIVGSDDTDEVSVQAIVRTLIDAEINALTELGVDQDVVVAAPAMVSPVVGHSAPELADVPPEGPLLSVCVADWISEKQSVGAWTEKTTNERESALDAFTEICADRPISAYAKADGRKFKETIQRLCPNYQKMVKFRGMGLAAIAKLAKKEDLPKPTSETTNKKLAGVSSFFSWLERNYDEAPKNPILGLKLPTDKHARDQRSPFTVDELNKLFKFSVWTGCRSKSRWASPGDLILKDSAMFWVPLIALFSGMRLSEITQLDQEDVKLIGGVLCFSVHGSDNKRVKTRSSIRDIPVHQILKDIGFDKFLSSRKKSETRLFSDIEIGPSDNPVSPASKRFIRLLKEAGIKTNKNAFHSFRHNFEDGCRNSNIPMEITNALQGHAADGMAGRYGNGYASGTLNKELQKLHYDGLGLSHIIEAKGC